MYPNFFNSKYFCNKICGYPPFFIFFYQKESKINLGGTK